MAFPILLVVTLPMVQPRAPGERLAVVEGQVRFAGAGAPVSGATVVFFERDDPDGRVVADGEGRFRWTVPGGEAIRIGGVGENGPPCRVIIQGMGNWPWEIVGADAAQPPSDYNRKDCFRKLQKPATSHWAVTDRGPRLIVECPAAGDVSVVVRGPDGAPVADRPVRVYPAEEPLEFHGAANVEFRGRTDAAGAFRLRWYEGRRRLRVLVPGVGFGTTGAFEVLAGRTVQADLPPLMRFAQVEGTVDPKLLQPGMIVDRLPDMAFPRAWSRGRSAVDAQGRFVLRDVVAGSFAIAAGRPGANEFSRQSSVRIRVEPGQILRGMVIPPPPPPERSPAGAPSSRLLPIASGAVKGNVVWVEGTVRDPSGRGVAGAGVVVRTSFYGGIRMYEQFQETTTDAQGHYQVQGPLLEAMTPLIVVVHARGRLPVVGYAAAPSATRSQRHPLDLTLADPAASGSMHVRVLKDGKPLPDVSVALNSEGVTELDMWARETKQPPAWTEAINAFYPRATTGADGVAHFANVFPGVYEVIATGRDRGLAPRARRTFRNLGEQGVAQGIGLSAGQEVELEIEVHPLDLSVPLQVFRPDGKPVTDQRVSLSFGLRSPDASTSLNLDARGIGSRKFESPGLWAVDVRFRDSPLQSFPVYEEPYYQVEAVLPVSPAWAFPNPIPLKGSRRERGSLRVELRDINGKPARGAVMFVSTFAHDQQVDQGASIGAQAVVRFADLAHGDYTLRGSIDGLAPPFMPGTGPGPLPDDAALRDQVAFADQTIGVATGVEAHVVLQPKKVGYVRGTIRPPTGRGVAEYGCFPLNDGRGLVAGHRLDEKTGEFVAGPFLAGTVTLRIEPKLQNAQAPQFRDEPVEVVGGTVTLVELRLPEEFARPQTTDGTSRMMLGMGGLSFLNEVPPGAGGTAWLADGKTPAFGARGVLLAPGLPEPVASAVSDAAGQLTWRGRWVSTQAKGRDGKPAPKPKAVVWVPGRYGAAVVEVEPDKPVRAVLPPPLDAQGAVTLAGRPSAGVNARIQIVAGHQGQGELDAALSLATSADAQGRFRLRGLTPGRYRVQAARDGIWLSSSVPLTVEAGRPSDELTLDIPPPGAETVVELVDRQGRPVPQRSLTLTRPEGPLAALWPTAFRTDSDGRLTLRGLETGTHAIQIGGEPVPRRLPVPEARGNARAPEVVRFVCDVAP